MSFDGGADWDAIQVALHAWVVACTGLSVNSVVYGGQKNAPRPAAPGIVMRINEDSDSGDPWLDHEANFLTLADDVVESAGVEVQDALKLTGHAYETGDGPVRFTTTGVLPSSELAIDTDFWLIRVDADNVRVAASLADAMNGVSINLNQAGSGVHTIVDTATTTRVGESIRHLARSMGRVELVLECHAENGVGLNQASAILNRIRAKYLLPLVSAILDAANIGVTDVPRVQVIRGRRDAALFEPRAHLEVVLSVPFEDSEVGEGIERAGVVGEGDLDDFEIDQDS